MARKRNLLVDLEFISGALHVAADKYRTDEHTAWAGAPEHRSSSARVADQFRAQAKRADELADLFEQADDGVLTFEEVRRCSMATCIKCGRPTYGAQPCNACATTAHLALRLGRSEFALCAVLRTGTRDGKEQRLVGPFKSEGEAYGWVSRQPWYRPGVSAYDILPLDAPDVTL